MDIFFTVFPIIFLLIFCLIFALILSTILRELRQRRRNDRSPRLTVMATVISQRQDVSYHNHAGKHTMRSASSRYYATFQVESGDRMELELSGAEYGLLMEGDYGRLTFQGTRYLSFERERN